MEIEPILKDIYGNTLELAGSDTVSLCIAQLQEIENIFKQSVNEK